MLRHLCLCLCAQATAQIGRVLQTLVAWPLTVGLIFASNTSFADDSAPVSETLSYDRDVRPILAENCFSCHGFDDKTREADLRLDTREGAVDQGGAIVQGKAEQSPLIERVYSQNHDEQMPPPESGKSLNTTQKSILRRWINEGAVYEKHWAFRAPEQVAAPELAGLTDPIDRFIQHAGQRLGLQPSPLAAPATLIRRASLDLIGLPPKPAEIDAFEKAYARDSLAAYHDLLESLLASPHFGERWGRWWLDQARYADSHGYSVDGEREIWKYRDWVVNALNENMPFDQFTIEQLAGDLLPGTTEPQKVATGFHRNTQINQEGGVDPEQFRMDSIFDRVATTGNVWLGLSIGCAQCHNHKFDPITQKEYYQFFAFFNNQDEPSLKIYPPDVNVATLQSELQAIELQMKGQVQEHEASLNQWIDRLDEAAKKQLTEAISALLHLDPKKRTLTDDVKLLLASGVLSDSTPLQANLDRHQVLHAELAKGVNTLVLAERAEPRKTHVLIKGDFTRPDEEVTPGTLRVLHPLAMDGRRLNRLDLANWIVSPENPLTSRVIVNRIWQQLFGRGIVQTENDFGLQGTPPTHPELLDWLAVDFRTGGWNIKNLLHKIMSTHTYMQSSKERPEIVERDPLNLMLARQNRLRLDAELIRDVALVASGMLVPTIGGPPVYPPIPDGVMSQGQVRRNWKTSQGDNRYRRALYTFTYRVTPPPSLNVFDAPDGLSTCTRRIRSNTPLQALTLLNDKSFFEFATELQKKIDKHGLAFAFQSCTSRAPSDDELKLLAGLDSLNAARALLNLDETINRE